MQTQVNRQVEAGAAISAGIVHSEASAQAWGKLAAESIAAGNFKTAIERLKQAITVTSYSQYRGTDFDK
jgi:hypothetical protein